MNAVAIEDVTEAGWYDVILPGMTGPIRIEIIAGAAGMLARFHSVNYPTRYILGALAVRQDPADGDPSLPAPAP